MTNCLGWGRRVRRRQGLPRRIPAQEPDPHEKLAPLQMTRLQHDQPRGRRRLSELRLGRITRKHRVLIRPRRHDGLLGDRQITGAGGENDNPTARRSRGRRGGGEPKGAADAVLLGLGKSRGEMDGLLAVDAGGQAILVRFDQLTDNALDPLGSFTLAKDHFGETAALAALEINLGES